MKKLSVIIALVSLSSVSFAQTVKKEKIKRKMEYTAPVASTSTTVTESSHSAYYPAGKTTAVRATTANRHAGTAHHYRGRSVSTTNHYAKTHRHRMHKRTHTKKHAHTHYKKFKRVHKNGEYKVKYKK